MYKTANPKRIATRFLICSSKLGTFALGIFTCRLHESGNHGVIFLSNDIPIGSTGFFSRVHECL